MEIVKLFTTEEIIYVENNRKEKYIDNLHNGSYEFRTGKIYGLVGEVGSGGEAIVEILTGRYKTKKQKIYFDDVAVRQDDIMDNGWYLGKLEYSSYFPHYEISVKKALKRAIHQYKYFNNIDEVIDMFYLKRSLINYKLSQYSGERLRASLAIGYSSKKNIFCFPWMNSADLYHFMTSGKIYAFFEELKRNNKIVIIPTSKKENVRDLVDEIIKIENPTFDSILSKEKQQETLSIISLK